MLVSDDCDTDHTMMNKDISAIQYHEEQHRAMDDMQVQAVAPTNTFIVLCVQPQQIQRIVG